MSPYDLNYQHSSNNACQRENAIVCRENDGNITKQIIVHRTSKSRVILSDTNRQSPAGAGQMDFTLDLPGTVDGLLNAPSSPSYNDEDQPPSALEYHNRMQSIAKARDTFHHDDTTAHDDEIRAGAANSLVWRLGYGIGLLSVSHAFGTPIDDDGNDNDDSYDDDNDTLAPAQIWSELAEITAVLSQVYKCSPPTKVASFQAVGRQLLRFLVHLIGSGFDQLSTTTSTSDHPAKSGTMIKAVSDAIVGSLRILRSYAKVSIIRPHLLCRESSFVHRLFGTLTKLLQLSLDGTVTSYVSMCTYTRLHTEVLGLLKDMSHRCSDSEAALVVDHHPDILREALRIVMTDNTLVRNDEYAATMLWNLASRRLVRRKLILLGGNDNDNDSPVLGFLARLISSHQRSNQAALKDLDAQKAALSALGNLARGGGVEADESASASSPKQTEITCEDVCTLAVLTYGHGSILAKLLSIAVNTPVSSNVARRRALRTIRCLVRDCGKYEDRPLALQLTSKLEIDLVGELSRTMMEDNDGNVRIQAAESIVLLYQSLSSRNIQSGNDLEAMEEAFYNVIASSVSTGEQSKCTNEDGSLGRCAEIACSALSSSASTNENTRARILEERPHLLPSLLELLDMQTYSIADFSDINHHTRLAVLKLLHSLSQNELNRNVMLTPCDEESKEQLKQQGAFGLVNLLDTLAELLRPTDAGGNEGVAEVARAEIRAHAAGIIVELSRNTSPSQRALLDHPTLLGNFMAYCTQSPDGPVRAEAKKAAFRLVSSL